MAEDSILSSTGPSEPAAEPAPVLEPTAEAAPSSGNWREGLPENLQDEAVFKDIPDVSTLAKAYQDAQSFIGRSIRIPTDDANEETWTDFRERLKKVPGVGELPTSESDAETWSSFYSKMGRPETPEDYKVQQTADGDFEAEKEILSVFHDAGLTNDQAAKIMNWMSDGTERMSQELSDIRGQAINGLRTEWGQAFDTKVNDAKKAISAFGGQELADEITNAGLGDSPLMIKAFAEIGSQLSESVAENIGGQQGFSMTPTAALDQIADIMANASHPYNDETHPNHATELERMSRLYQAAYPSSDKEPDYFEQRLSGQPS